MAALGDSSVNTIKLSGNIEISRSSDGKDNALVIGRAVTITGGGLSLERAGIILGGNVTFQNISISMNTSVRNAIIANGHSLTLDGVQSAGTYNISLFCGGVTDYCGGNGSEIPTVGTSGHITIKDRKSVV